MDLKEILRIPAIGEIGGRDARFLNEQGNAERIAEAVSLCMGELRCLAPELSGEKGKVFESMLRQRVSAMLKGGFFFEQGHGRVNLPALAEDFCFFGDPWMPGTKFLAMIQTPVLHEGRVLALEPGSADLKPLGVVSCAWDCFAEAAGHAKAVVQQAQASVDQLRGMSIQVRAVVPRGAGGGFVLGGGAGKGKACSAGAEVE